jgi:hypothetical protein
MFDDDFLKDEKSHDWEKMRFLAITVYANPTNSSTQWIDRGSKEELTDKLNHPEMLIAKIKKAISSSIIQLQKIYGRPY